MRHGSVARIVPEVTDEILDLLGLEVIEDVFALIHPARLRGFYNLIILTNVLHEV